MKTRRLTEDQTVRWAIFIDKEGSPENVVEEVKNWGVITSKDLDDARLFDSEKEALEMKNVLNDTYPMIKEHGYVDCVICYNDEKDPFEQVRGWIQWWNKYGHKWYRDNGYPQETKPPALRSDHELYIGR